MHKNNNMMGVEDLNMGEEVTYAIGSIEEGVKHDKERAKTLSRFVNH
jgi:hypothetical protein